MEKLKKSRAAVRSTFTRTYNSMWTLFQDETPNKEELQALLELLQEKMTELEEWNSKITENVQNDDEKTSEELARELDGQDEYKLRYISLKNKTLALLNPIPDVESLRDDGSQISQPGSAHADSKRFRLPKMEHPKFSGELKDWLQFWSLYKGIHQDPTISKAQKFGYLVPAMAEGSRARELVLSFPPTEENYDEAIAALTNRFGKEDLLVEMYIRELLKLVLHNAIHKNETRPLESTYDKLKTQLRSLGTLGVTRTCVQQCCIPWLSLPCQRSF